MKKIIFLIAMAAPALSFSQPEGQMRTLPLIPMPNEFKQGPDEFILTSQTRIVLNNQELLPEVNLLQDYLKKNFDLKLEVVKILPSDGNYIIYTQPEEKAGHPDEYDLYIDQNRLLLNAEDRMGVYYATQTLFQLMPLEKAAEIKIPCVQIHDSPRYEWRGMHLDCSRHFFTKEEVKKYIDYMAMYKFNVFHWHLTDDQGWRIEIKKYPLLTAVGSKRKQTIVGKPQWEKDGSPSKNDKYDGTPYGGFYTQDDIREIVAYANARYITVVPEIEMPGHSLAALAAYPQLSCKGGPFETYTKWGVSDDVYCAGNDSVFTFMQDVLSEVMDLFPGKYIHIGGDECPKDRWKACPKCQKRIADEHLKNEEELQSYFITRMERFLNAKGKQIIGWDEILEGGLAPNAAVMSWRGTAGGIAAAKQKHYVVMTPGRPCYFDHYQSKDKSKEPLAIGGFNPLDSVYAYDPTPKALSADEKKYIMGAQGNVWTEYIVDFPAVEYMAVPRMAALSEVLWTQPEKKDFKKFQQRLAVHAKLLDKMNVNYAKHFVKVK